MEFGPDDIRKLQYTFVAFFAVVPVVALVCAKEQWYRRILIGWIIFFPTVGNAKFLAVAKVNFTLMSVEWYRGHATGFTISMQDILGVALLIALLLSRHRHSFRFFPPGMIFYLIFFVAISVSIFQAPRPEFTLMAIWNFAKMFLFYIIAYNIIRGPGDLRAILWGVSLTLLVQCLVGFKMRYADGYHQISGMFDHQNSMSSWAYFCGLPLLSMSLSRHTKWLDSIVYLIGYGSCGLLVILSISRGAFLVLAAGSILIIAHAILQKVTLKRAFIVSCASACGAFVLFMAMDSILGRFIGSHDYDKKHNLRTVLEEISHRILDDNPHGIGLNNYNVMNSRPYTRYSAMLERWNERRGYWFPDIYYTRNPNTENLYWMFLAETGYIGFAGLMLFLAYSLYICLRNYHFYRNTRQGSFILGLAVVIVLFMLHSRLERVLTQIPNLMMFVMFVALVSKYDTLRRRGKLSTSMRLWKFYHTILDSRQPAAKSPSPAAEPSTRPEPTSQPAHA